MCDKILNTAPVTLSWILSNFPQNNGTDKLVSVQFLPKREFLRSPRRPLMEILPFPPFPAELNAELGESWGCWGKTLLFH